MLEGVRDLEPNDPDVHHAGSTKKADFISYLRGTDMKYRYVKFEIDFMTNVGTDKETLTAEAPVVGAASIPGVP